MTGIPLYDGVEAARQATREAKARQQQAATIRQKVAETHRAVARVQRNYAAVADRKDAAWGRVLKACELLLQLQQLERQLDRLGPVEGLPYAASKRLIPELVSQAHSLLLRDETARQVAGHYSSAAYNMAGVILKTAGRTPSKRGKRAAEGLPVDAIFDRHMKRRKKVTTVNGAVRRVVLKGADAPKIVATASSTAPDLEKDAFSLSALRQMKAYYPGHLAFVNHSYKVPEDVFGVIEEAIIIKRGDRHDLDVLVRVEQANPRAVQTLDYIRAGTKLGVSVGVIVREAQKDKETGVMMLTNIEPLELSIVGIPANQTAWTRSK